MINVMGILFSEDLDSHGEIVSVQGADLKDRMPIKSANGNLLGTVTEVQAVYRAITDESVELAMRAGLVKSMPAEKDENAITGMNYLELEKPFVRIKGTLIDNMALRAAIKAGNLFFSIEGKVKERKGEHVLSCIIDHAVIGINSSQNCTKVFLDEDQV